MKGHNLYTILPYKNKLLKFKNPTSARAYYKNYSIDLLTGDSRATQIEDWLSSLEISLADEAYHKRIIHLFYELGLKFNQLESLIASDQLLAIDIQYGSVEDYVLIKNDEKISLKLYESLSFKAYEEKFNRGYRELKEGNCYQFNLTSAFKFNFKVGLTAENFISALWIEPENRGAYASATYIEFWDKLFLSNSPECLFQYDRGELVTRPIKGTLARKSSNPQEIAKLWKKLKNDKKSEAELYMIADLLRNDLCRIDKPVARVTKKKALLLVPHLIHQYSEIKVVLDKKIYIRKLIEKIFPGGSVTGAPKKRVMGILHDLEDESRNFYCGSTLLLHRKTVAASINIRSSEIDLKNANFIYRAGGGITLLSTAKDEFLEMTYKLKSTLDILTR